MAKDFSLQLQGLSSSYLAYLTLLHVLLFLWYSIVYKYIFFLYIQDARAMENYFWAIFYILYIAL